MKKNGTIKQHYVPRAFLSKWCDEDEAFYPIKIKRHTPPDLDTLAKSGPYPFCCEKYFYANQKGNKDEFSQTIEDGFSNTENIIYPIIDEFENKVLTNKQITFDDKLNLSSVMLFLHLRGKQYLEWSRKSSEEMAKKVMEMKMRFTKKDMTEDEIRKLLEGVSVDFGTAHHLKSFKNIEEFSFYLASKYWKIHVSKSSEFIVTDTPYLDLAKKTDNYLGNSIIEREQFFILSPKIHISIAKPNNINSKNINRKDVTNYPDFIDYINMISLMNSVRFGFHKDKKVLDRLKTVVGLYYKNNKPDYYL